MAERNDLMNAPGDFISQNPFVLDNRSDETLLQQIHDYAAIIPFDTTGHSWADLLFMPATQGNTVMTPETLAELFNNPGSADGSLLPQQVFLLAFMQLLKTPRTLLNAFPSAHRELYYRDLLGGSEKAAQADHVALSLTLKPTVREYFIPAGTLFDGGQDSAGTPLRYALDKSLLVNRSTFSDLRWVQPDPTDTIDNVNDRQLFRVAFDQQKSDWPTQGYRLFDSETSQQSVVNGRLVASSALAMNTGDRKITLTLASNIHSASLSVAQVSSGGQWLDLTLPDPATDTTTLELRLPGDAPAISAPVELDGLTLDTPVIKLGRTDGSTLPALTSLTVSCTGSAGVSYSTDNGTVEDRASLTGTLLAPAFIRAIRNNVQHPDVATAYLGLLDIAFRTPSSTLPEGAVLYSLLAEDSNVLIQPLLKSSKCTSKTFDVYFSLLRRAIGMQADSLACSEEAVRGNIRMKWLAQRVYKTIPDLHVGFIALRLNSAGLLPTEEEAKAYVKSKNKNWYALFGSETINACQHLIRHATSGSGTALPGHSDGEISSLGLLRFTQHHFHTSLIQAERVSRIENKAISIIQSAIKNKVRSEVRRQISEQYLKAAKKLETDHPSLPEARRQADMLRREAINPSPVLVEKFSKEVAGQIFKERNREFIPYIQQEILRHANLLPLAQTYDPEEGAMVLPRYADYIASSPAFTRLISGLLTGAGSSEDIFHLPALLISHPDSGAVVSDSRLSEAVTALSQQMPQYHFSRVAEQNAGPGKTTAPVPTLRLRSTAPLIADTELHRSVSGGDARKLTTGAGLSNTVLPAKPVLEKIPVIPAENTSPRTRTPLPQLSTRPSPSVASPRLPVNLRDISHVHAEASAPKISQMMDVYGRMSSGVISQTETQLPAVGGSGATVRPLRPGGNVHILQHSQDENLSVPSVFHAGSGRNTWSGAHIVTLSDILPSGAGTAEHTQNVQTSTPLIRQFFSGLGMALSSSQNEGKLTLEEKVIRADVARRTHEVFTPDLMTAISSRHTLLQETARNVLYNSNIGIVTSEQYENLIRVEGASADAGIFSDKMQAGDRLTLDATAHTIVQNAPSWREELRAEQEAKYLEAKRETEEKEKEKEREKEKDKEKENEDRQQANAEEEKMKQEKNRSGEEKKDGGQQEEML